MLTKVNTTGYLLAKLAFSVLVASVTACAVFLLDPERRVASRNPDADCIKD